MKYVRPKDYPTKEEDKRNDNNKSASLRSLDEKLSLLVVLEAIPLIRHCRKTRGYAYFKMAHRRRGVGVGRSGATK